MASTSYGRLIQFASATFHTGLFFLVFVIVAYASGALGGALGALNTLVGVAIFLLFWLLTWLMGVRVLVGTSSQLAERHSLGVRDRRLVLRALVWAGVEGLIILFIGLWVALFATFASSNTPLTPASLIEGLFFLGYGLVLGSSFAFVIGAFVGLLFVIIDFLLLGMARLVFSLIEDRPVAEAGA